MNGTSVADESFCTAFGVYSYSGISIDLRNNIFVNSFDNTNSATDVSYSIYMRSPSIAFTDINNNDYYVSGSAGVLGFLEQNQYSLSEWQTATGKDLNSFSADPGLVSNNNLHNPNFNIVNNNGTHLSTILTDIDGDERNNPPDIGADEYSFGFDPTDVSALAINDSTIQISFVPKLLLII